MGVNIVFFKPIWDLGASPYELYGTILCVFSTTLLLMILRQTDCCLEDTVFVHGMYTRAK